jgi:glycine/D-amino acid oxidase-like deaminating enzyme
MQATLQQTPPLWTEGVTIPEAPPLTEAQHADVCVVGAGIAGVTTAYLLAREGRSVVVLDAGPIGGGETQHTTAHLSNVLDDRFQYLEQVHGPHAARLAAESHGAAVDRIGEIARAEGIDCDYERLDGYLFLGPGQSLDLLKAELRAAVAAGLSAELLPRAPWPHFDTGPCLRFPGQGQFHPLKYLAGLTRAARRLGVRFFGEARAKDVRGGAPARVATQGGPEVTASAVVVATNAPVNDLFAIHTKQAPYLSYVVAAEVPRGAVPHGLYWDMLDPYHYVRLQPAEGGREVLVVGGEDHKTARPTTRGSASPAWRTGPGSASPSSARRTTAGRGR